MIQSRVVAIIQARMGSTRLPGKILLPLGGRTVLANVVARAQGATHIDDVVIATTTAAVDNIVAAEAHRLGVDAFRGSEDDVLDRYRRAARQARADTIVRITSDCPLLDASVVDVVIDRYLSNGGRLDYVSNTIVRSYPRGLDVEVFSAEKLDEAAKFATAKLEREHVTQYIRNHTTRSRLGSVEHSSDLSRHRWTLDTPEDMEFMRQVFDRLPITEASIPSFLQVVDFLDMHPEITALNSFVEQK